MHLDDMPRATKPDRWTSATRIKLRGKAKVHKPADSGGSVVRCARRCSQPEFYRLAVGQMRSRMTGLALQCEALPKRGRYAAQREQAPSPRVHRFS